MELINVFTAIKYKKSTFFDLLEDIPYAVIKGEALSLQAYGQTGKRISSDIDVLCDKIYLKEIEVILSQSGFVQMKSSRQERITMLSGSHQVSPWVKNISPSDVIKVDLNFDIFWGEYTKKRININTFLNDVTEANIYQRKVKVLPPLKAMVQLILHHYKDMNSIFLLATRNSIKNDMFKEILFLLLNNADIITVDKLYEISAEYNIIPYVYYIFHYTNQIFGNEIMKKYEQALKTPEGIDLLDYYGLSENERRQWKVDFKTRLETENRYLLIKDDLTEKDIEKIERNKELFKSDGGK